MGFPYYGYGHRFRDFTKALLIMIDSSAITILKKREGKKNPVGTSNRVAIQNAIQNTFNKLETLNIYQSQVTILV